MAGLCNAVIIHSFPMKQACNSYGPERYLASCGVNPAAGNNSSNVNEPRARTGTGHAPANLILNSQAMDMNEPTREEMNARLETIDARMDARFAETDAKNAARFAEAEAKNVARFAEAEAKNVARFAQTDAKIDALELKIDRRIDELVRWLVVTAIAAGGVAIAGLALVLNNIASRPPVPVAIPVPQAAIPSKPQ
jgi:hypothetical protein